MGFVIVLFVVIVGSCYLIAKSLGNALFPKSRDNRVEDYVDKSVHHHHYHNDNRTINVNGEEFKSLKK